MVPYTHRQLCYLCALRDHLISRGIAVPADLAAAIVSKGGIA